MVDHEAKPWQVTESAAIVNRLFPRVTSYDRGLEIVFGAQTDVEPHFDDDQTELTDHYETEGQLEIPFSSIPLRITRPVSEIKKRPTSKSTIGGRVANLVTGLTITVATYRPFRGDT